MTDRAQEDELLAVRERLRLYLARLESAPDDERVDRDDDEEPSLTFGDLRALSRTPNSIGEDEVVGAAREALSGLSALEEQRLRQSLNALNTRGMCYPHQAESSQQGAMNLEP